MADRMPYYLTLGGPIPKALLPELFATIASSETCVNWEEPWDLGNGEGSTPDELAAALLKTAKGKPLNLTDDDSAGYQFEDLQGFLQEHGIAHDLHHSAKHEINGWIERFRPGFDDSRDFHATQSGDPAVRTADLLPAGNDLDALLDRFDWMTDPEIKQAVTRIQDTLTRVAGLDIAPVPPITIV